MYQFFYSFNPYLIYFLAIQLTVLIMRFRSPGVALLQWQLMTQLQQLLKNGSQSQEILCNSSPSSCRLPPSYFIRTVQNALSNPSARGSGMGYVGTLTQSHSKFRNFNREDMGGRNKTPNPHTKHTWRHRGETMKGKESEMSKRQYKGVVISC